MNKLDFDNLRKLSREQLVDYIVDNIGINDFPTPNKNVEWTMYGRETCPFCVKAHELLESVGNFVYVDIENIPSKVFQELIPKKTGNYQYIPIIFNRNKFIGGYDNLVKLIENKMSPKVAKIPVSKINTSAKKVTKVSPKKVTKISPKKVTKVSPKKVTKVSPKKVTKVSPKKVTKVSPKKVTKISPKKVTKVSPKKVTKISPKKVTKVSPKKVTKVSPKKVTKVSPKKVTPKAKKHPVNKVIPTKKELNLKIFALKRKPLCELNTQVCKVEFSKGNRIPIPLVFVIPTKVTDDSDMTDEDYFLNNPIDEYTHDFTKGDLKKTLKYLEENRYKLKKGDIVEYQELSDYNQLISAIPGDEDYVANPGMVVFDGKNLINLSKDGKVPLKLRKELGENYWDSWLE